MDVLLDSRYQIVLFCVNALQKIIKDAWKHVRKCVLQNQ
jgi:hypothetical protein